MKGEFVVREVLSDPRRFGKTLRMKQVEEAFRKDGTYAVQYVVHEETVKPLRGVPVDAKPLPFGAPADIAQRLSRAAVGWAPTFPRASVGPRPFPRWGDFYDGIVENYSHESPLNKQMQEWLTRKGAYGSTIKSREA